MTQQSKNGKEEQLLYPSKKINPYQDDPSKPQMQHPKLYGNEQTISNQGDTKHITHTSRNEVDGAPTQQQQQSSLPNKKSEDEELEKHPEGRDNQSNGILQADDEIAEEEVAEESESIGDDARKYRKANRRYK